MPSRFCRAAFSPPCWRWCTRFSPASGIPWWTSSPSRWAGRCYAPTSGSTRAALEIRGEGSTCRRAWLPLFQAQGGCFWLASVVTCVPSRKKDQGIRITFDAAGTRPGTFVLFRPACLQASLVLSLPALMHRPVDSRFWSVRVPGARSLGS